MRLEVTRKSDLAIRILRALPADGTRLKGPELAEVVGSTVGFVPQVLAPLSREGWVRSDPGPTGGYSLTADLNDVSVLDVIEAIEGPAESGRCVLTDGVCDENNRCTLHEAWGRALQRLRSDLDDTSVAQADVTGLARG